MIPQYCFANYVISRRFPSFPFWLHRYLHLLSLSIIASIIRTGDVNRKIPIMRSERLKEDIFSWWNQDDPISWKHFLLAFCFSKSASCHNLQFGTDVESTIMAWLASSICTRRVPPSTAPANKFSAKIICKKLHLGWFPWVQLFTWAHLCWNIPSEAQVLSFTFRTSH